MKHLAYLNKYFIRYKWRILGGILFVICANFLSVLNPVIAGNAVNVLNDSIKNLKVGANLDMASNGIGHRILMLFLLYLGVALLSGGFTFLMRQTIIVVSRLIEFDLKNDIYKHYQQLDQAFGGQHPDGLAQRRT